VRAQKLSSLDFVFAISLCVPLCAEEEGAEGGEWPRITCEKAARDRQKSRKSQEAKATGSPRTHTLTD